MLLGPRLICSILIIFSALVDRRRLVPPRSTMCISVICLRAPAAAPSFHPNPGGNPLSVDQPRGLAAPSLGSSLAIVVIRSNSPAYRSQFPSLSILFAQPTFRFL